jgi:hypothetical protein
MNTLKHLTPNEILAYADDLLPHKQLFEIGRHLIDCEDCRRLLPVPTVEQFRSAIMTEWETNENSVDVNTEASVPSNFSSFWKLPSVWALAGATLIVLVIFTLLLQPSRTNDSSAEIVRKLNNETKTELNLPAPIKDRDIDKPLSSENSNKTSPPAVDVRGPKTDVTASKSLTKIDRNQNPERKSIQKREQISTTRGATADCSEEKRIEWEYSTEKEDFVFKWKKVPNAVKYHLYISDDEEILIDEYETTDETSFVLRKPLDPEKTYKWKIIITLENGQTVVGPSSKFTVKDFQTSRLKPEKKKNTEIRCPNND